MFDTTLAVQEVMGMITDVSLIVAGVVSVILGLVAALVGLGWGIRKFLSWVMGGSGGFVTGEMEYEHDMRNRVWKGGGNEM